MAYSVDVATGYLENARRQKRLAHAYLITGSGRRSGSALAGNLIRMLNGGSGDSIENNRSEFVHVVAPKSKSRRILLKQIHELERWLYMASPADKTKIAIIEEADRLGQEAENAFLKTLEEPPDRTLILLITSHPQQLLDTILSRCIRVPLRAESGERDEVPGREPLVAALRQFFQSGGRSVSAAIGLAGVFGEILKSVKADVTKRFEADLKAEAAAYEKRIEGDWLSTREEYYKAMGETAYLELRNRLVDTLLELLGDAMRLQQGVDCLDLPESRATAEAIAGSFDSVELARRFGALEGMRSLLETNTNEKLVLEGSFLEAFG